MNKKAILWTEAKKVIVTNLEVNQIEDNEILIETAYSSVSPGSESTWLSSDASHMVLGTTFPFIPGYAASGIIKEVGKNIQNYHIGDRVICNNAIGCHASLVVTTEDHIFKVPDTVTLSDAVFFQLGMTSIHCVRLAEPKLGEPLVIVGQGPIGLMATQAAKATGAYPIITLELDEKRRQSSIEVGADFSVDPRNKEEYIKVMSSIGGGSPRVIDLTGSNAGMKQALDAAAPLATVVYSSATLEPQTIDYGKFFVKGITLKGAFVNARLKEQYEDDRNFLLLVSRKQMTIPDYTNEIYNPDDAPLVYEKILQKDGSIKNPIFKWK